jgi:PAS domain-containing protein
MLEHLRSWPRPSAIPLCASPFFFGPKHPLVTFLDAFEDVISIYDTEYNFIYGNLAWEKFFEKPRSETYQCTLFTMWVDGRFTLDNPVCIQYHSISISKRISLAHLVSLYFDLSYRFK